MVETVPYIVGIFYILSFLFYPIIIVLTDVNVSLNSKLIEPVPVIKTVSAIICILFK